METSGKNNMVNSKTNLRVEYRSLEEEELKYNSFFIEYNIE